LLVAGRGIATSRTSLQEETARALEGHVYRGGGREPEESGGGDEADEEANEESEVVGEGDDDLVGADVRVVLDCC
jgi:hypothetical protein